MFMIYLVDDTLLFLVARLSITYIYIDTGTDCTCTDGNLRLRNDLTKDICLGN